MQREVLKSKVHRTMITEANLNSIGSHTLDADLKDVANIDLEEAKKFKPWVVFRKGGDKL